MQTYLIRVVWGLAFCIYIALSWKLAHGQMSVPHDPNDPNHFYEYHCCDLNDCRLAKPGEVVEGNGGFFILSTDQHFKYGDDKVRYKATDGRFHVCQYTESGGDLDSSGSILLTRCIYVPPGGV